MEIKFIVDVVIIIMCYHITLNTVTYLLKKLKNRIEESIDIVDMPHSDW